MKIGRAERRGGFEPRRTAGGARPAVSLARKR
jgi:hypothetical protein